MCASWAEVKTADLTESPTIVVRVRLNSQDKGDVFAQRQADGSFLIRAVDLKAMGFRDPNGEVTQVEDEPYITLNSMRGVSLEFKEADLTLSISAEPALLEVSTFAMPGYHRKPRLSIDEHNSGFFNYAFTSSHATEAGSTLNFAGEGGWRFGDYGLVTSGTTVENTDGTRKFVRLLSSVTHDDRDSLRRTVVGDFFTLAPDSSGVALGGISISKVFGLNPYFIQFPLQSVGGTAALPSELEIYVDGQRLRTEKLQPGEFQVQDLLAYGGARNVQLVLRDPFGRTQQLDYSLYFSDQPLRTGLHEYSYNAGAIRRRYGVESNQYGPPAATMFHRYGLSNAITLGVQAAGKEKFASAGPSATVMLGNAGVLTLVASASSTGSVNGQSGRVAYAYQTSNWNFSASLRRDSPDYAVLGDPPVLTNRKAEDTVSASYHLAPGTVSLSRSIYSTHNVVASAAISTLPPWVVLNIDSRRITTLSYSTPLIPGRASLSASLNRIDDSRGARTDFFVGAIFFFDKDYSASASFRDDSVKTTTLQLTKNQPIGEGMGFRLSADHVSQPGNSTNFQADVQYNAPAAILRAELAHSRLGDGRNVDGARLSLAGGVGFAGGQVAVGRPITGSFGIVKVGDLPDVEVSVNGQPIGKTDWKGTVFIPTLMPYYDNDVAIAAESLPLEYSMSTNLKTVSPSPHAGSVLSFEVKKIQAVTGRLNYAAAPGGVKPVEFKELMVEVGTKQLRSQTGRNGEFYLEDLGPGIYRAAAALDDKTCRFELVIPASTETFIELGTVQCRVAP
jgi:outer membrane usher protein